MHMRGPARQPSLWRSEASRSSRSRSTGRRRPSVPVPCRRGAARVEDALPRALPVDVVILNPPRTGASMSVIAALRDASPSPRAIVYVSCDPATLARDVGRLAGWRIAALRSFDMFPQTAHVETVCELVPEGGA